MPWGLIAGALGLGGSLYAGSQNRRAAEKAQARQLAWEREKLDTYHQREVQDLRKAGLNPLLSVQHSTPTGSISAPYGEQDNPGESGVRAYSAAQQARVANKQLDIQEALATSQVALNSAVANRENKQSELMSAQTGAIPSTIELQTASAEERRMMAQNLVSSIRLNNVQVDEARERINNIRKNLEYLQQQIRYSKTDESRIIAVARYNDARSQLAIAQQNTEILHKRGVELDNRAKELGMTEKDLRHHVSGGLKAISEGIADIANSALDLRDDVFYHWKDRSMRRDIQFREDARRIFGNKSSLGREGKY